MVENINRRQKIHLIGVLSEIKTLSCVYATCSQQGMILWKNSRFINGKIELNQLCCLYDMDIERYYNSLAKVHKGTYVENFKRKTVSKKYK